MGLRHFAEVASRNVRFRRTLPEEFGKRRLYVSPGCGLRYWLGISAADRWLLGMVRELVQPGDVVWDICANLGVFSFAASAIAGPEGSVLAVEADTWLVDLLRRTESLTISKAAGRVTILPVAASDHVGVAVFNIAKRARAANHLSGVGYSQAGGIREQHSVISVTLDWLLERTPAPDVLKIDVEGAEEMVLAGAAGVLSKAKPKILCEVGSDHITAVTRLLGACGYEMYDAEVEKHKRVPIARAVWNTLAIPK